MALDTGLNIEAIHDIILTELRLNYPGLKIVLEGQSNISPVTPRIMYVSINEDRGGVKRVVPGIDTGPPRVTVYKNLVYETFRYSIIVNEETKGPGGESFNKVLKDLSKKFIYYMAVEDFLNQMNTLGVSFRIDTGLQDGTISKAPFFERRKFFDLTFGYCDIITSTKGSIIETVNYERTNP